MTRTLLVVMNPRAIPECMDALRDLRGVDKAWCSYYTETQLEAVIPSVLAATEHDRVCLLSDDTVPTQAALDRVLELHDEHPDHGACGWVNVDAVSGLSTVQLEPLGGYAPDPRHYNLVPQAAVEALPPAPIRTYFHGAVLFTMARELWQRFPFMSYNGCASDLHQSWRLQEADIPIWTHPLAYVHHVKEKQNVLDKAPAKRLLIGHRPARVTMEYELPT
jgi:hypothetical protein